MTTRQGSSVPLPGRQEQVTHIPPDNHLDEYSVEKGSPSISFTFPKIPVKIMSRTGVRLKGKLRTTTPNSYGVATADLTPLYGTYDSRYPVYLSSIGGVHAMINAITLTTKTNAVIESVNHYHRFVGSYFGSVVPKDVVTTGLAMTDRANVWVNNPHLTSWRPTSQNGVYTDSTLDTVIYEKANKDSCGFIQRNHLDWLDEVEFNILLQFGNNNNGLDLTLDQGFTVHIDLNSITQSCYTVGPYTPAQSLALIQACSLSIVKPEIEVTYIYDVPSNFTGMPGEAGSGRSLTTRSLANGEWRYASYAYSSTDIFGPYNDKQIAVTQNDVKRYKFGFRNVGLNFASSDPCYTPPAMFDNLRLGINQQPIGSSDPLTGPEIFKMGFSSSGNWHGDISRVCNMDSSKGEYGAVLATIGSGWNLNGPNTPTIKFSNFEPLQPKSFLHDTILAFGSDIQKVKPYVQPSFVVAEGTWDFAETTLEECVEHFNLKVGDPYQWTLECFVPGQAVTYTSETGLRSSII